ncbi:MAG TPA: PadR family transcriptional regulator [Vicinamibacterales bacterium]|nr:PadR family transcriptional regulator [Vicinamibacterales bacterium]
MGSFETMVLLAILRLGNRAYGMEVREEIERSTGREISYGAVYSALDRLEVKGFVAYALGDPTPERGGRARKYFRVLAAGRTALRANRTRLTTMWKGVD